jgi:hypothetical protein
VFLVGGTSLLESVDTPIVILCVCGGGGCPPSLLQPSGQAWQGIGKTSQTIFDHASNHAGPSAHCTAAVARGAALQATNLAYNASEQHAVAAGLAHAVAH